MLDNNDFENYQKAKTQQEIMVKNSCIIGGELLIISIALGVYFKSWWVFGLSLIGLSVLCCFKVARTIFIVLLSLVWGFIGWGIGSFFHRIDASVVIALLAFGVGFYYHFTGIKIYDVYKK